MGALCKPEGECHCIGIAASSTELKLIQTLHSSKLFREFRADKTFTTCWSGCTAAAEFKFESKFEPLPVIWQTNPMAIPGKDQRF